MGRRFAESFMIAARRVGRSATPRQLVLTSAAAVALAFASQLAGPGRAEAAPVAPPCGQTLPNIQRCITDAARGAFRDGDGTALAKIGAQLRAKIATDKGPTLFYRTYWLAYTDFMAGRLAITLKRPEQAKALALEADRLLDGLPGNDQEANALHYLVVLLQYPVSGRDDMGRLIAKSTEMRAKLGDASSVRALYARAQADYFTPKEYGGGRLAEKLLRQALAAPPETQSPLKPTWGRDDCAALLIRILKASGNASEAQVVYTRWHAMMPDSVALGQLAGMR
jgi:tetratricopeptide (TPR) repeat protein